MAIVPLDRVPADRLPPALPGEGAYAASGTNVAVFGPDRVWIGSDRGARLRSLDGGLTWTVANAPLAHGASAGIFSIAFRDAQHGIVVGGDYREESEATDDAAVTVDGGAAWKPVRGLSGFRSVVAWIPGARRSIPSDWPFRRGLVVGRRTDVVAACGRGVRQREHRCSRRPAWATGEGGRISKLTLPSRGRE